MHVYNALLATCDRAAQFERGLKVFEAMKRSGVRGNATTQQLLLVLGQRGMEVVEGQQAAAAALTAAVAAAGTLFNLF